MSVNKLYDKIRQQLPEPQETTEIRVITQPNSALKLRDILRLFAEGDNSVLSHLPTNDDEDTRTNQEFDSSIEERVPHIPEDDFEALEFIQQTKQSVIESVEEVETEQTKQKEESNSNDNKPKVEQKIEKNVDSTVTSN